MKARDVAGRKNGDLSSLACWLTGLPTCDCR